MLWLVQAIDEADEPGSIKYNQQMWRRQRNERMIIETALQAETTRELSITVSSERS